MFAAATSVAIVGVEPRPVRVEVHLGGTSEKFTLVGLPDTAVREARDRVTSALVASRFGFPHRKVTVNLAPADLPKVGSAYDLPIALALLACFDDIPESVSRVVALGELALDGAIRSARGGLGAALVARALGLPCLLPPESAAEAAVVPGADIKVVRHLAEAVSVALHETPGGELPEPEAASKAHADLADVRGQLVARRALEVAAAGGHHLLMTGPPGAGKTMLARCLPGILPTLTPEESLEVAQAWAAAGRRRASSVEPPFRSPHHSATPAAVLGGGSGVPVPGELTLAHRGVLFLDELGEFPPGLLDGLRQPLEEGEVRVARKGISVGFPCSVQLIGATNPCPCGFLGDARRACRCSRSLVERYRRRLSGPLLDRFDVRVPLGRLDGDDLAGPGGEPSRDVRSRVEAARHRQAARGGLNRDLPRRALDTMGMDEGGVQLLRRAVKSFGLSGRGWDRVRRVARTIGDLDGCDVVAESHVAEALGFRGEV